MSTPIVYLIRHAEKSSIYGAGKDSLSTAGADRAQALTQIFGKGSGYDIQHIIVEKPKRGTSVNYPAYRSCYGSPV
jgi:hypothetical protein